MPHGGARPGAGRKPLAANTNIRQALDHTLSAQDWEELIRNLFKLARQGNMRASELLLKYRFGDPKAIPPPQDELKPIQWVHVIESPPPTPEEARHLPDPWQHGLSRYDDVRYTGTRSPAPSPSRKVTAGRIPPE